MARPILTLMLLIAFAASAAEAGAKTVLLVRKGSRQFEDVSTALKRELGKGITVVDHSVTDQTTYEEFAAFVKQDKPDVLVLLDNRAVGYGIKLNAARKGTPADPKIPAVAGMALNLKKELKGNSSFCGVAYEVPAFTLFTGFRFLTGVDLKDVLTVYRASEFGGIVEDAKRQLARERVNLVALDAEAKGRQASEISAYMAESVATQTKQAKPGAVWIMADNGILNRETLKETWLPLANSKIPLLCGVEELASKELGLCVYAASPELDSLGKQLAEMTLSILDDGLAPRDIGVKYVVTVKQTINLEKLKSLDLSLVPGHESEVNIIK